MERRLKFDLREMKEIKMFFSIFLCLFRGAPDSERFTLYPLRERNTTFFRRADFWFSRYFWIRFHVELQIDASLQIWLNLWELFQIQEIGYLRRRRMSIWFLSDH